MTVERRKLKFITFRCYMLDVAPHRLLNAHTRRKQGDTCTLLAQTFLRKTYGNSASSSLVHGEVAASGCWIADSGCCMESG